MGTQIQDVVRDARRDPSRENLIELWHHIFHLKAWYLLPNRENEGPAVPMLIERNNDYILPVFTNVRRLRDFWETAKDIDGEDVPLLPLSPVDAVGKIQNHKQRVGQVTFNPDSDVSVSCPTEALIKYADYFNLPDESELR